MIVGTFKDIMTSLAEWQSVDGVLADIIDTAGKELNVQGNRTDRLRFFPVNNRLGCEDPSVRRLRQVIDKAVREDPKNYVEQPIPLQWLRVHDELRRRVPRHSALGNQRGASLCPGHPRRRRARCGRSSCGCSTNWGSCCTTTRPDCGTKCSWTPSGWWTGFPASSVPGAWTARRCTAIPRLRELQEGDEEEFGRFRDTGVASRRLLETMIADDAGDAAAPVVIRLMEKFALLCEYDDGSKRRSDENLFLVPAVLPRDIPQRYRRERVPATAQAPEQLHRCAVQFTRFMPQGMWERMEAGARSTPRCGATAPAPAALAVGSVALRGGSAVRHGAGRGAPPHRRHDQRRL